nr:pentatricopeptide repeat-containing protein At3g62890-like [Ipomoea batatas]
MTRTMSSYAPRAPTYDSDTIEWYRFFDEVSLSAREVQCPPIPESSYGPSMQSTANTKSAKATAKGKGKTWKSKKKTKSKISVTKDATAKGTSTSNALEPSKEGDAKKKRKTPEKKKAEPSKRPSKRLKQAPSSSAPLSLVNPSQPTTPAEAKALTSTELAVLPAKEINHRAVVDENDDLPLDQELVVATSNLPMLTREEDVEIATLASKVQPSHDPDLTEGEDDPNNEAESLHQANQENFPEQLTKETALPVREEEENQSQAVQANDQSSTLPQELAQVEEVASMIVAEVTIEPLPKKEASGGHTEVVHTSSDSDDESSVNPPIRSNDAPTEDAPESNHESSESFSSNDSSGAATLRCSVLEGRELHSHVMKMGFGSDVYVRNTLINMYAVCGNRGDARKVFDESPVRDLVSWNSILAGYVEAGNAEESMMIYDQMPRRNMIASNSMIVLLGRCSRVAQACRLFHEMDEKDLVSWTALISCYEQNGFYEEALDLFVQICGDVNAAQNMFDTSRNLDQISWNSIIFAYVKCGSVEKARVVFDSMVEKDRVSWTTMISGYAQHDQFSETLALFQEMLHIGVKPDETTLVSVVSVCTRLAHRR